MRSTILGIGLMLAPISTLFLAGAVPPAIVWTSVAASAQDGVDLRSTQVVTSQGPALLLKNFGTRTLHFGYYCPEPQTSDQAPGNGRVHLKPKATLVVLLSPAPRIVTLLAVCVGDQDGGDLWQQP